MKKWSSLLNLCGFGIMGVVFGYHGFDGWELFWLGAAFTLMTWRPLSPEYD